MSKSFELDCLWRYHCQTQQEIFREQREQVLRDALSKDLMVRWVRNRAGEAWALAESHGWQGNDETELLNRLEELIEEGGHEYDDDSGNIELQTLQGVLNAIIPEDNWAAIEQDAGVDIDDECNRLLKHKSTQAPECDPANCLTKAEMDACTQRCDEVAASLAARIRESILTEIRDVHLVVPRLRNLRAQAFVQNLLIAKLLAHIELPWDSSVHQIRSTSEEIAALNSLLKTRVWPRGLEPEHFTRGRQLAQQVQDDVTKSDLAKGRVITDEDIPW